MQDAVNIANKIHGYKAWTGWNTGKRPLCHPEDNLFNFDTRKTIE